MAGEDVLQRLEGSISSMSSTQLRAGIAAIREATRLGDAADRSAMDIVRLITEEGWKDSADELSEMARLAHRCSDVSRNASIKLRNLMTFKNITSSRAALSEFLHLDIGAILAYTSVKVFAAAAIRVSSSAIVGYSVGTILDQALSHLLSQNGQPRQLGSAIYDWTH